MALRCQFEAAAAGECGTGASRRASVEDVRPGTLAGRLHRVLWGGLFYRGSRNRHGRQTVAPEARILA